MKDAIELEGTLRLELTIHATFEFKAPDNISDIDDAIIEALDALKGHGTAGIISRKLFGVPKEVA